MVNGKLNQFLDTGWHHEAELFYQGHLYWCEGSWKNDSHIFDFFVCRWKAENVDNVLYRSYATSENKYYEYCILLEMEGDDPDKIKQDFLKAKIFDGKSFWEVEKEIIWMDGEDYDHPIYITDDQSIENQ